MQLINNIMQEQRTHAIKPSFFLKKFFFSLLTRLLHRFFVPFSDQNTSFLAWFSYSSVFFVCLDLTSIREDTFWKQEVFIEDHNEYNSDIKAAFVDNLPPTVTFCSKANCSWLVSFADPDVLHSLWIYWKNMKNHNALNRDGEAATFCLYSRMIYWWFQHDAWKQKTLQIMLLSSNARPSSLLVCTLASGQ